MDKRMKPLALVVVACVVGWLAFQTIQPPRLDPKAVSRAVEARGDLAGDELAIGRDLGGNFVGGDAEHAPDAVPVLGGLGGAQLTRQQGIG